MNANKISESALWIRLLISDPNSLIFPLMERTIVLIFYQGIQSVWEPCKYAWLQYISKKLMTQIWCDKNIWAIFVIWKWGVSYLKPTCWNGGHYIGIWNVCQWVQLHIIKTQESIVTVLLNDLLMVTRMTYMNDFKSIYR